MAQIWDLDLINESLQGKDPKEVFEESWPYIRKLSKSLERQWSKSVTSDGQVDFDRLDQLEAELSELRLQCAILAFCDAQMAQEKNADGALWQGHLTVHKAFRKAATVVDDSRPVEKRRFQTHWNKYLKLSQSFYVSFISRLGTHYGRGNLGKVAERLGITIKESVPGTKTPPETQVVVHHIVYMCIIRIGDLTRYQHQIKQERAYLLRSHIIYALAQEFEPDIGLAHNQMAVTLDGLGADRLSVIFHFFMSAISDQKQVASRQNIASECKKLLAETDEARKGIPAIYWFLQLHANLFLGKLVSTAKAATYHELEDEVLNRVEQLVKEPVSDTVLSLVIMMGTNMSAWHASVMHLAQLRDEDSNKSKKRLDEAVFLQNALVRLNLRFAINLLRIFTAELDGLGWTLKPDGHDDAEGRMTPIVAHVFPCVRLIAVFLVAHWREFLVAASGTQFYGMTQDLLRAMAANASALTTVANTDKANGLLHEAPYSLMEEDSVSGMPLLFSSDMPPGCRLGHFEETGERRLTGVILPGYENQFALRKESDYHEFFFRVRYTLRCYHYLASQPEIPIVVRTSKNAPGYDNIYFVYEPADQKAQQKKASTVNDNSKPETTMNSASKPWQAMQRLAAQSSKMSVAPSPVRPAKSPVTEEALAKPNAPVITTPSWPGRVSPYQELSLAPPVPESTSRQKSAPLDENVRNDLLRRLEETVASPGQRKDQPKKSLSETTKSPEAATAQTIVQTPVQAMVTDRESTPVVHKNQKVDLTNPLPTSTWGPAIRPATTATATSSFSVGGAIGIAPGLQQALDAAKGHTTIVDIFKNSMNGYVLSFDSGRENATSSPGTPSKYVKPARQPAGPNPGHVGGWAGVHVDRMQARLRSNHSTPEHAAAPASMPMVFETYQQDDETPLADAVETAAMIGMAEELTNGKSHEVFTTPDQTLPTMQYSSVLSPPASGFSSNLQPGYSEQPMTNNVAGSYGTPSYREYSRTSGPLLFTPGFPGDIWGPIPPAKTNNWQVPPSGAGFGPIGRFPTLQPAHGFAGSANVTNLTTGTNSTATLGEGGSWALLATSSRATSVRPATTVYCPTSAPTREPEPSASIASIWNTSNQHQSNLHGGQTGRPGESVGWQADNNSNMPTARPAYDGTAFTGMRQNIAQPRQN